MVAFRIAARLDLKPPDLIKTMRLEGVRKVGCPDDYALRYRDEMIDEVIFLDVVASLYRRSGIVDLLANMREYLWTPLIAAGGVRSVEDARALLASGADVVALNTGAHERPELIGELAEQFGSSNVTIQVDAKRRGDGWEARCDGGRQATGRDAVAWATEAVERGAGQVFVTSVDREGTGQGFDLDLVSAIRAGVNVPIVISGGFGEPGHAVAAAKAGADGVAIAGALHYGRVSIAETRGALIAAGIETRTV